MSDDTLREAALDYHRFPMPGKISVQPTKAMATQRDLSLAYSPGVADACMEIAHNPAEAMTLTSRADHLGSWPVADAWTQAPLAPADAFADVRT